MKTCVFQSMLQFLYLWLLQPTQKLTLKSKIAKNLKKFVFHQSTGYQKRLSFQKVFHGAGTRFLRKYTSLVHSKMLKAPQFPAFLTNWPENTTIGLEDDIDFGDLANVTFLTEQLLCWKTFLCLLSKVRQNSPSTKTKSYRKMLDSVNCWSQELCSNERLRS